MSEEIYSVIAATGSYIPEKIVRNEDFLTNTFYDKDGKMIETERRKIIQKFEKITEHSPKEDTYAKTMLLPILLLLRRNAP